MSQLIDQPGPAAQPQAAPLESQALGAWLVLGAAVIWSLGGIIARLAAVEDPWTTVAWRSGTATLFLLGFMLLRDGAAGTRALFARMGPAGLAVAGCFTVATTCFVLALQYTTVANILLMLAGVPLIAALISRILFGEHLRPTTWLAIAAVIAGVAVMVSDSLTGRVSPLGDGLSLLIALSFASATVITRRCAEIRMTPAVCSGAATGCAIATAVCLVSGSGLAVEAWQMPVLGIFGLSMGLGMALFTQGARLIPSALAALISVAETILGPIWVWIFLDEVPGLRTIVGGAIVLAAILAYLAWQILANRKLRRIAPQVH